MLALPADQIHLWLVFSAELDDERLFAEYRALASAAERAQAQRFYFERDRRQYLITRALVRSVLSRYCPAVAPADWRFDKNRYGRPEIANPEALPLQLSFNISHTAGLVLLGVTHGEVIGVDTENTVERAAPLELAPRYFSSHEAGEMYGLPAEQQAGRFFDYWTLKESYIKARGMGLSIPLDQFSFDFSAPRGIGISFHAPLQDDPLVWRFWQFRPSPDHLAALCVRRPAARAQQIVMRRGIPLVSEAPFDCPPFRATAQA